jgi:hypothetical protein
MDIAHKSNQFMAIFANMTNEMIFLLTNDHFLGEDFSSQRKAFY